MPLCPLIQLTKSKKNTICFFATTCFWTDYQAECASSAYWGPNCYFQICLCYGSQHQWLTTLSFMPPTWRCLPLTTWLYIKKYTVCDTPFDPLLCSNLKTYIFNGNNFSKIQAIIHLDQTALMSGKTPHLIWDVHHMNLQSSLLKPPGLCTFWPHPVILLP